MATSVTITRVVRYQQSSMTNNTWYEFSLAGTTPVSVIKEIVTDLKKLGYVNVEYVMRIA